MSAYLSGLQIARVLIWHRNPRFKLALAAAQFDLDAQLPMPALDQCALSTFTSRRQSSRFNLCSAPEPVGFRRGGRTMIKWIKVCYDNEFTQEVDFVVGVLMLFSNDCYQQRSYENR